MPERVTLASSWSARRASTNRSVVSWGEQKSRCRSRLLRRLSLPRLSSPLCAHLADRVLLPVLLFLFWQGDRKTHPPQSGPFSMCIDWTPTWLKVLQRSRGGQRLLDLAFLSTSIPFSHFLSAGWGERGALINTGGASERGKCLRVKQREDERERESGAVCWWEGGRRWRASC